MKKAYYSASNVRLLEMFIEQRNICLEPERVLGGRSWPCLPVKNISATDIVPELFFTAFDISYFFVYKSVSSCHSSTSS